MSGNTRGRGPLAAGAQHCIGFVLSQEQFTIPQLIRFGCAAEQAGFDAVWTSDHFQPWQDNEGHAGQAWITLAALGGQMPRIPMGTGVTCPTYRYNPAIVAQAFASLGLLYPGRVFLGVGTGEALNEAASGGGWGDYQERADRLVEAVQLIRDLWTGKLVNHDGQYYPLHNARLYDVPDQPVPIYMAASGEESMRHAGQYGDGLITDPKSLKKPEMMAAFREGAQAAGKDPATLPIIVEHWAVAGDQQEAEAGAELWRFIPHAWDKYVENPDPRAIRQAAEAEVPLPEVYKDWPVSRDAQTHIQGLQELLDAGATHIFVHSPQADQEAFIRFYGEQVLPKIRGR